MPDPATDTREVAGRQVSIPRYPPCVRSRPFPEKVPHKPEQGPLPEVRQDQPNVEFRPASPYGYWWQLQRGAGSFWIDPTLGTTGSGAKSPPLYGRRAFGLPITGNGDLERIANVHLFDLIRDTHHQRMLVHWQIRIS